MSPVLSIISIVIISKVLISKVVISIAVVSNKHSSLRKPTQQLTTESAHYESRMFYSTGPCGRLCRVFNFKLGCFVVKEDKVAT